MNDNSTDEILIMDYVDERMSPGDRLSFEKRLNIEPDLANQLRNMQHIRDAVKRYGLNQQVSSIRREMLENEQVPRGIFRNMSRTTLKAAASIIVLLITVAAYQYSTLSPERLYNERYKAYSFTEKRGSQDESPLKNAYREKKMNDAIGIFNHQAEHTAEDYFIAGNAYLRLGNSEEAISAFNSLLEQNKQKASQRFQEDAEYYLALSYLSNHEVKKAIPIFEKINADKSHAYHDMVGPWFLKKLHWVDR